MVRFIPIQLLSVSATVSVLVVVVVLNFGVTTVSCSNILIFGAVGSYSQRISIWPLVQELSKNGHNLTYLSAAESKDYHPEIQDYVPKPLKGKMGHFNFYHVRKNKQMIQSWFWLLGKSRKRCELLYSDKEFVSWIKSSNFELVIVDGLMNECVYSMVHYWKAKMIIYSTTLAMGWHYDTHGLPDESSSVTDLMYNFPPGRKMNFLQRFVNAMTPLVWKVVRENWYLPKLEEISRKGLEMEEMPSFTEIERNVSLLMITTHYTLDYPRSLPPNAVAVGGVAVGNTNLKPMPKELENFINKSPEGFIYISFGSVAEFALFEVPIQREFIKAIKNCPQFQFIWKAGLEIKESLPKNVLVTPWAPQLSLLAHPKIRAFISHTGMGSTTESIHFPESISGSLYREEQASLVSARKT